MKVALVTESFLPSINGVTNSVLRILETLRENGDQALVIAPANAGMPDHYAGHPVKGSAAIPTQNFLPVDMPMGLPQKRLKYLLEGFNPDVIHLASPFALGAYAAKLAKQLNLPTISVYQTEIGGFAKQYGLGVAQNSLQKILYKIHSQTDRTLAPSKSACLELYLAGVPNVYLWQRGVNTQLFHPSQRKKDLQKIWRNGNSKKTIVGYVGRLAKEKRVADLSVLDSDPQIQLVIVGEGAHRRKLEQVLPNAIFLGFKSGQELASIYASFDLFVHPGPNETFCQTVQEALASGVPAIVPKTGGAADLIVNNSTGYIIDTANSNELLAKVKEHRARSDRKQISVAARSSVSMRTWQMINNQLLDHYQQVIQSHQSKISEKVGVA
jgi:phosphatidylinositol alpha 1,6-mannosyltransferase